MMPPPTTMYIYYIERDSAPAHDLRQSLNKAGIALSLKLRRLSRREIRTNENQLSLVILGPDGINQAETRTIELVDRLSSFTIVAAARRKDQPELRVPHSAAVVEFGFSPPGVE